MGSDQWASIAQAIRATENFVFIGPHQHHFGVAAPVEVNTSHFSHEGKEHFLSITRNINQRLALERDMNSDDSRVWKKGLA